MKHNNIKKHLFTGLIPVVAAFVVNVAAQTPPLSDKDLADGSGFGWGLMMTVIVMAALGVAFYLWRKSKKGDDQPQPNDANRYRDYYSNDSYDMESVDAAKEMEWLRKAKKSIPKTLEMTYGPRRDGVGKIRPITAKNSAGLDESNLETKEFQAKMRKMKYAQLPINSFSEITPAKKFEKLPVSDDPSLLNAIEQANEEFEEDESVRDLAVRILTAFRNRNSVDALSQIALYDLSSNLRSKAVTTLTGFDHESVFEAILLACADPTREVRAAAARGLFRLNFDRADAWKRIVETGDEFRIRHAARAAIEAGIVDKAFERLVHEDLKVSYEAFVLVALLIKSEETEEIFDAIQNHKDERVKFALLDVLKIVNDERSLAGLNDLRSANAFPTDVSERLLDAIKSLEHVPA